MPYLWSIWIYWDLSYCGNVFDFTQPEKQIQMLFSFYQQGNLGKWIGIGF
jgi:hypothetical protein